MLSWDTLLFFFLNMLVKMYWNIPFRIYNTKSWIPFFSWLVCSGSLCLDSPSSVFLLLNCHNPYCSQQSERAEKREHIQIKTRQVLTNEPVIIHMPCRGYKETQPSKTMHIFCAPFTAELASIPAPYSLFFFSFPPLFVELLPPTTN